MWSRIGILTLLALPLLTISPTHAEMLPSPVEPSFCAPDVFLTHEIPEEGAEGIKRLHAYRLGAVVLAGMAIGESDAGSVSRLAERHGVTSEERFCTWYVNKGNAEAEQRFRQIYLPNPSSLSPDEAAGRYGEQLGPAFAEGRASIWWCLEEKGFLAVGCNGQLHRGPTVFGMVLAALGCSAEHAAEIVNRIWGLNGVPPATRFAAIKRASDLGFRPPGLGSKLREQLSDSAVVDTKNHRQVFSPALTFQPPAIPETGLSPIR